MTAPAARRGGGKAPPSAPPGPSRAGADEPRLLRRAARRETFNDAILVLFALAIAWAPFLFGSNDPVAWSLNAMLFGTLLLLFEAGVAAGGGARPVALRRLWGAVALFLLIVAWIAFQFSALAPEAWDSVFWEQAREVLARAPNAGTVAGRISATPDEGVLGLLRLVTCAAAFYLALQLCRDPLRARFFVTFFIVAAAAYAIYGIVQQRFFPDAILWQAKMAYRDAVTSTFINRNTYATYAGLGLVATIGMLIGIAQRDGRRRSQPLALRAAALIEALIRHGMPLLVVILIVTIALLGTGSRAGIVATLLGVLALMVGTAAFGRRRIISISILAVVGAMMVALLTLFGGLFADRLADGGGIDVRLETARRTFEAALDVPWTGFGYGSFQRVFPVYRDPDTIGDSVLFHWSKAHNSYVELMFDIGLPASIAFALLVLGLIILMLRNALRRETTPTASFIALGASVLVLAHAALDFSLQIQGVTLTYWALLGFGLGQSWSRRVDTRG